MNNQYKTISPEVELVQKFFSPATKEDHEKFWTATEICHHLMLNISGNLRISPVEIGKALKLVGHTQCQMRRNGSQSFPEKGYYIKFNQPTTYY
jgi:hypothetical protein